MRWAGHGSYTGEKRNAYRVSFFCAKTRRKATTTKTQEHVVG
jgi:hypothetical protein